jgi:hypothetical protein
MRAPIQSGALRFFLAAALAVALGGAAAEPARGEPPLRVKLWVDRGPESIYYPGESVWVTFTVNDDAYVCLYNIDTEGRVQVLFPPPGDPGFVHAHEVVELPGAECDFEYVVLGPPGIETIEAIASRASLAGWEEEWSEEWETDEWDERRLRPGDGRDSERGDEDDEDWDEGEEGPPRDDGDGWDEGFGGREMRLEARPIAPPRATGVLVSGDPFVAIRRVNRRLLPAPCAARDYDTAVLSFYVGRRVSYPRYTCNDCHGFYHGYDPYADHCSVFSVRLNAGWVYTPHHVVVHDVHVIEPRYVYVRHPVVPSSYKHLKRAWPSHDRYKLKKEFRDTPAWKSVEKPGAGWATTKPDPESGGAGTKVRGKGKTRPDELIKQQSAAQVEKPRKAPPTSTAEPKVYQQEEAPREKSVTPREKSETPREKSAAPPQKSASSKKKSPPTAGKSGAQGKKH